jgi:hypothetical protein
MARTKATTVRTSKRGGLTINFSETDGKALAKQINEGKDPFGPSGSRKERLEVVSARIDRAWGEGDSGGIAIAWQTKAGFGELVLTKDGAGQTRGFTEYMSREFCKEVLAKLVDSMTLEGG